MMFRVIYHSWKFRISRTGCSSINNTFTVRQSTQLTFKSVERFTNYLIKEILKTARISYFFWGGNATKIMECIPDDKIKNHFLTANHPCPLSAKRWWFGCKHFSKTNEILKEQGKVK